MKEIISKNLSVILTIVVGIVLALVVTFALMRANSGGNDTYLVHFGERYSLAVPTNWIREENLLSSESKFTLQGETSTPFIELKVIDAYKKTKGVTAYSNEFLDGAEEKLSNFSLQSLDTIKLLELDCPKITYTYEDGDVGSVKSIQVDMLSGKKVFRINYTSSAADFDKYYPVFEKTLSYLRVY